MLAAEVGKDFHEGEGESEEAGGKAAHGEHECEPAGVGVGTLASDAAAEGGDVEDGEESGAEYEESGTKDCAGVWLKRWHRLVVGTSGAEPQCLGDLLEWSIFCGCSRCVSGLRLA